MINENSNSYKPILYNVNIEQNHEQLIECWVGEEYDYHDSSSKSIENLSQQ